MYHEHFGLREFPFKFSLSNTLFLGAVHLEGLAKLEGAFCEPSGLTLLVGEAGTGKTRLIHALLAPLNDDKVRVVQLTNPTMSFAEMLEVISKSASIRRGEASSLKTHNSLLLDGSTLVEPQYVRPPSAEIEYLPDVSGGQDGQPIEARCSAVSWMLGRGKPLMARWLSALAVAGALALEFGSGRSGAWFAKTLPANVHRDEERS